MSGEFNICGQSISRVTRAVLGTSWPVAGAERMGGGDVTIITGRVRVIVSILCQDQQQLGNRLEKAARGWADHCLAAH